MYKIWCEWDMGEDWENTVFISKELAEKSLLQADWDMVDMTLEEVKEQGLVSIEEIKCEG